MADKKFSQFTDGSTNQSPTDELVGLDISLSAANQNTRWTLNNLFSKITRNITDKVLRFQSGSSPTVSANNESALYSNGSDLLTSSNGSAYTAIAGKPVSSDKIFFVSPNGNDSNDGLSWGTAKRTIAAAAALLSSDGGKLYLSGGTHNVTATITFLNQAGIFIVGAGMGATQIQPVGLGGSDVFKFANCRDSVMRDLRILGAGGVNRPASAIHLSVEAPRTLTSINLCFENILIGSDSSNSFTDGFLIDNAGPGFDLNNEQHTFINCEIRNVNRACWNIAGINAEWHKIFGGHCTGAKNAVLTNGGSFTMIGTNLASLGITEPIFDFTGGTLAAGPITVSKVRIESANFLLRTDANSTQVNFDDVVLNGGAGPGTVIDWNAIGGYFKMNNSNIAGGGVLDFNDSASYIFLDRNQTDGNSSFVFGANNYFYLGQNNWGDGTLPGGYLIGVRKITADYTAAQYDDILEVDTTSGPVNITLLPIGNLRGKVYTIKKIDTSANAITITADIGEAIETISGSTSGSTTIPGGARGIISIVASESPATTWYAVLNNPALLGAANVFTAVNTFNAGLATLSKAGDPTASDLAAGRWALYKNTSSGAVKLWANDGGVLKSVTLT